jgi:hypothetical protein
MYKDSVGHVSRWDHAETAWTFRIGREGTGPLQ